MEAGRRVGQAIVRNVLGRRNMGGYGHKHHKQITMNDLPTPHGDFFELHAARQKKHRAVLFIGIAMFASSLIACKETKLINLNYSPPDSLE